MTYALSLLRTAAGLAAVLAVWPPRARADAPRVEELLARADALAREARAAPDEDKARAVDVALEAYAAVIRRRPKDGKLVPRVRRRRASLLKHAGRAGDALAEYDAIVEGRARRKDKARALYDGGRLLERGGDFHGAGERYERAVEEYRDVIRVRAQASLARGRVLERMRRPREAERAYCHVVDKCRDEAEAVIGAYDALALLALKEGRSRDARRWLQTCTDRFAKRAARDDRYGRFVARLLGSMKAPAAFRRAAAEDPG